MKALPVLLSAPKGSVCLKHDEIEALEDVDTEVNELKHAKRSALPSRKVDIETAVKAAEQAERLLKRALETEPGG